MTEIDLTGSQFEDGPNERVRFNRPWGGMPPMSPDGYFRAGRLAERVDQAARRLELANPEPDPWAGLNPTDAERAFLGQVLAEVADEESAVDDWADDPETAALMDELDETPYSTQRRADDLANARQQSLDLSNSIELAEAQAAADRHGATLARHYAYETYKVTGDFPALAAAFAEVGPGQNLVAQFSGGLDNSTIELGRLSGEYPSVCSETPDDFGRCRSQYHSLGCSHVAEAEAAYGATPEASDAWRGILSQHSDLPMQDSDGRVWEDRSGQPMRAVDHFEAATGQRQGEGVWLGDRARRRELRKPAPSYSWGDPDSGTPGRPFPGHAVAQQVIAEDARLQPPRPQPRVGRNFTQAEDMALARKLSHPDFDGETTRERNARIRAHQPRAGMVSLSNGPAGDDELLCGELPRYTHGML